MEHNLIPFEGQQIRNIEHNGEMWFSVVDVIGILSDSSDPSNYWTTIKLRDAQLPTICRRLKMLASDGKQRLTDCANTEGVLRIIQSVPSPKAEPFKMWLAGLGKQAIEAAADPELLTAQQAELYRAKGYSEKWISARLKTIQVRNELTDEWKGRGVVEGQEYSLLTATIAKETFGLTPSEHSKLKGLKKENLRDHMTSIELILTALSEEVTRMVTVKEDAQGFNENLDAAVKGGKVGRTALKNVEKTTGEKVVSAANFLNLHEDKNKLDELSEGSDKTE